MKHVWPPLTWADLRWHLDAIWESKTYATQWPSTRVGWHHSHRSYRSLTLTHIKALLLTHKVALFCFNSFSFTCECKNVVEILSFSIQQILILRFSKVKKKTHKLAIQSSPSFFNLWLRRLLEIGSNALTPARHCALTGVSSSISGGWSWRRHPELGRTLAPFSCFLSHTPLNNPPPPPCLHCVLHHFIYFSSGLPFIFISSSWNDQLLSRLNDPFSPQCDQKKIKVCFGVILLGGKKHDFIHTFLGLEVWKSKT